MERRFSSIWPRWSWKCSSCFNQFNIW